MNSVQGVANYPAVNTSEKVNVINFKAQAPVSNEDAMDMFIKEQKKAKKDAKRQQTFSNIVLGLIGLSAIGSLAMYGHQAGWFKRFKLNFKDLSKEKSLEELALPESQKLASERITNRIKNYAEIIKKGGKKGSSILFYGPPGTGKNTFAYAITKKFPNAKFIELDISKLNSKWFGESEQNILGTMEKIVEYAKKNPNEKVFVFIDEIDSVMMQDMSHGSKLSNDILNAFKKGFNSLANEENIIVMGATNLKIDPKLAMAEGKVLDSAMLDRFSQKVLVDLPTAEQLLEGIKKFYSSTERGMIDSALLNENDSRWIKITQFLSDHKHGTSFRKLIDILNSAAEKTKTGENVKFEDIIDAIVTHKENLNATDTEIQALINSLK